MTKVHDKIVAGLRDFLDKNGFSRVCLGMSGGIDSAVVLALACEVLPPENVVAIMLPSRFSSSHSLKDSLEMIGNLGVRSETISIEPAFEAILTSLSGVLGDGDWGTAQENIQARLRCVMLMAYSNKWGHVLLNTSNKSEAAVGYGTLYGDMAGAVAPIADIYKTEVYALARYMNREREIIPMNIIEKAPSAELRPDQRDSDSLPPYDILDGILRQLVEGGRSAHEVEGYDPALVERVAKLLAGAAFKRRQAAPAIAVSEKPFSNG